MRRTCVALLLASCAGCGDGPTSPAGTVPVGAWGGDHVRLTIEATSATVEFDCAHGTIPAPVAVDRGQFAVTGTYVAEHGGPIRLDEIPLEQPARYSGAVDHGRMTLQVRLSSGGADLGPYTLSLGSPGRVFKCL